jgi:long-chain acyl-CoA synthetase
VVVLEYLKVLFQISNILNGLGVMLSHRNLVAMAGSVNFGISITAQDVYLAYLPLAHIFELAAEVTMLASGAQLGYGSPRTLLKNTSPCGDIAAVRPTIMSGVPR